MSRKSTFQSSSVAVSNAYKTLAEIQLRLIRMECEPTDAEMFFIFPLESAENYERQVKELSSDSPDLPEAILNWLAW